MAIVPAVSSNAVPTIAKHPLTISAVVTDPPAVVGSSPFRSITTLSLSEGVDSRTFSNLATLSILEAKVGQASAAVILNAVVSYESTSVYGSGLSPQALSLSDQINELYRQVLEEQQQLRDQIAASDAAAKAAWDRGDFWDYIANKVDTLVVSAKLLYEKIAGLFLNLFGVFASFLEGCFSRWFGALVDTQNAAVVGGPRDPENVFVDRQSIKGLIPSLDPVKDIPRQGTARLRESEKASRSKQAGSPLPSSGAPSGTEQEAASGSVQETAQDSASGEPEALGDDLTPDQVMDDQSVLQEVLLGRREIKADLVRTVELRMVEAEALDMATLDMASAENRRQDGSPENFPLPTGNRAVAPAIPTPQTPPTPPPAEDPLATFPLTSQSTASDFKVEVATAIHEAQRADFVRSTELRSADVKSADRVVRSLAAEALRAAGMQSPAQDRSVGSGVPPEAAPPPSRPVVIPLPKAPVTTRRPEQHTAAPSPAAPAPAAGNETVREAVIRDILRDSLLRTSVNEEIDRREFENASVDDASQPARRGV